MNHRAIAPRRVAYLSLALCAAAGGCAEPPAEADYEVTILNPWHPTTIRVLADQHQVTEVTQETTHVAYRGRSPWNTEENPILWDAQLRTPCGWESIRVSTRHALPPREERRVVRDGDRPEIIVDIQQAGVDVMPMWIDNRRLPATSLAVGQLSLPIRANWVGLLTVPMPSCEAGRAVRLAGSPIGAVHSPDELRVERVSGYLVDPSGRRCYWSRMVSYTLAPDFVSLDRAVRLPPGQLKQLRHHVHYFLEPAPRTIQGFGLREERQEITEGECR